MKALMMLALVSVALLAGCTTVAPETRPYSVQERHELSLEALNRQGLSYDHYVQARTRLIRSQNANATGLVEEAAPAVQMDRDS